MPLNKRCAAEFLGTFWLVFGGCGSAVLAAEFPRGVDNPFGIAFVGVAIAFGLTVLTMAYAIGHISGCHLNPAVSFGLWAAKRFSASDLLPYIIAQVLGRPDFGCDRGGIRLHRAFHRNSHCRNPADSRHRIKRSFRFLTGHHEGGTSQLQFGMFPLHRIKVSNWLNLLKNRPLGNFLIKSGLPWKA